MAPFGTVAVIVVPDAFTLNVALLLPNFTAVAPAKLVPVMTTVVPTRPLVGENPLIVGGDTTTKLLALLAVPPFVVTEIAPVVAPLGTMAVICDAFAVKLVAATPLNATAVAPARFVPLIVTDVPAPPLAGEKLVIVGAAPIVTTNETALVAVPPAVVTLMGPFVAPAGTVALICVADTTV